MSKAVKLEQIYTKLGSYHLAGWGIAIFAFYVLTQRWFELYLQVRALQVAVVGLALLLIAAGMAAELRLGSGKSLQNKVALRSFLTGTDLLWLVGAVAIVLNLALLGNPDYYLDSFIYITGFAFLVLAKVKIEEFRKTFTLLCCGALIYGLGTFGQFLFTDQFNRFIVNFTVPSSQVRIYEMMMGGYYPGFAFSQPALAANYMALGLGLVLAFWAVKSKIRISAELVFSALLLGGIILTGKRSIFIWSVAALLVTYVLSGPGREKLRRAVIVGGAGTAALVIFLAVLQLFDLPFLTGRFAEMFSALVTGATPESVVERLMQYEDAWYLFLQHPLFGVGWKNFEVITSGIYVRDYHVHNVYLQLLSEMGLAGFLLIMAPLLYTYQKTYRALQGLLHRGEAGNVLWRRGLTLSFYYQTFFLLYCFTENAFYNIVYMLTYFLLIAIANAYLVYEQRLERGPGR